MGSFFIATDRPIRRIAGEPARIPRSCREAFADEHRENATGIEGPPDPYVTGWRALWRDLRAFLASPRCDLSTKDHE